MTTFQEPQPQSRRAVRQGERGGTSDQSQSGPIQSGQSQSGQVQSGQQGFAQSASGPQTPAPQFYSDPQTARDMWDTTARRAAQLPPAAPRQDGPAASGRRAAPASQSASGEPLGYSTQQKPGVPSYDGPSFRSRAPQVPDAAPQPPTQALPQAEQPVYRVRDFSPEGRRAASPQAEPSWSAPTPPSDLDYRTEIRPGYGSAPQAAPAPVYQVPPALAPTSQPLAYAPQPPATELPVEQTLSRRELRAMQQAEQGLTDLQYPSAPSAPAAPPALAAAPQYGPPEPATNTALTNALTEFDSLAAQQFQPAQQLVPGQQPAPGQQLAPAQQPAAGQQLAPQQLGQAQQAVPTSAGRARVGHWSTQAEDEGDVSDTTISRRIGSGSTATNALVLPTIPAGADIRGPLTGTGEIMLTGSIDLPRSLSSTGASGRLEHGGIDEFFDMHDAEAVSTDSSPVRAVRAVSTHTSGHGVTHTQKPKGTRALTALLIAASSMAVVVAGLLVAAFAFNVF